MHTHDVTVTGEVVRKCYVSWDDREPEREWAGLVHLSRESPGPAPTPIAREVEDGRPVVVMSLVPGEPLTGTLSAAQSKAFADALRRLFAVPVPEDSAERANGAQAMRDHVREWLAEDYDLTACQEPDTVKTATDRAVEWLTAVHLPARVDSVIAIGDGNLDNVLWDGEVCRLIDWEEYGASDLTYEIADVVEHASSRLTRSLDVDALLDTLDLDASQRERLAVHRTLLACFWLMMLLPGNGGFKRNPAGSSEDRARHVLELLR
ncbi:aminoglycoside phosphotransferase family protein [Nocardioides sp. B-3]|uniref:aminoglycoside phosphotransferase family protein n=1 Tax=Nocardioides sp. B-3 TaxID=2895565 RepID=UPI00215396F0|nr:aminoglycoside phosphotransferase family protein [Nocardioides sp. B-3]UUZ60024.1 aminoglycoside phosphotransferase family protein [Nocardioides sp. B-3]